MRKVVLYSLLSADGVAESPARHDLESDDRMRANLAQVVATQDAVLLGRRSYDEWSGYWPQSQEEPFAPFINAVDKYVVSSGSPDTTWEPMTVVDELRLAVVPTLADELRLLFDGGVRRHLNLLAAEPTPSGTLLLGYRVDGPV